MATVEQKEVSNSVEASSQDSGKNGENGKNNGHVDKPIMVARNKSGIVKWFSFKNGYGFITVDGDGDDIFVHRSEFIKEGAREVFYHVDVGDRLEFDIINRAKGREAVAVTGPNGVRVPGSPAGFHRRRNPNSERRSRNVDAEEHYEDAQEGDDTENQHPNGNIKKKGGRGGRRRIASGEGQNSQPAEGEPTKEKGDKGGRVRRPRKNTGGRGGGRSGPRGSGNGANNADGQSSDNQQENEAPISTNQ